MNDITVIRYESNMREQWNSFVKKCKNSLFLFDRNFMEYHSDRFMDHSLIFLRDNNIVALLPANEKENILISHGGLTYGGLLLDNEVKQHTVCECIEALITYAQNNRLDSIIYKPIPHVFHKQGAEEDLYAIFHNNGQLIEVSVSTVVNLKMPIKMPKGRKAQINRARREGAEVSLLEEKEDYTKFIKLENQILENRHNTRAVHTAEELYLLHSRFPHNVCLYGAKYKGKLIAGSVVFVYDEAVHTQYMASDETGKMIGALDLVISTIIDVYKDTKQWLDFGISTEDHGRYLNQGLIAQKEGFGGRSNIYSVWKIQVSDK